MKFKNIYDFAILDEIKKGSTVYVLDKGLNEVFNLNNVAVCEYVKMTNSEESNRYYFYKAVEVDE